MTIKVGATLTCNKCEEQEFIPHADTGDTEARKVRQGEWTKTEEKEGEIFKRKHYCPKCSDTQ